MATTVFIFRIRSVTLPYRVCSVARVGDGADEVFSRIKPDTPVMDKPLFSIIESRRDTVPLVTESWSLITRMSVVMPVVMLIAYIMLTPVRSCRLIEERSIPPTYADETTICR